MGMAAGCAAALFAGGVAIGAIAAGDIAMLPAIGLFPAAVLAGRVLPRRGEVSAHISLGAVVLGFGLVLAQLQSRLPWPVAAVGVALLVALVALNYRFYAFFAQKRGPVFAAAVLPFHLIYLLYSLAAFVLGFALHTVRSLPPVSGRYLHTGQPHVASHNMPAEENCDREASRDHGGTPIR